MKRLFQFLNKKKIEKAAPAPLTREELEKKVVEGAEKAVREYRRVFERLAEYDRTSGH